jgi:hypothetical protein
MFLRTAARFYIVVILLASLLNTVSVTHKVQRHLSNVYKFLEVQ